MELQPCWTVELSGVLQESFERLCLPAYSLPNVQSPTSLRRQPTSCDSQSSTESGNGTYTDAAACASLHAAAPACRHDQQSDLLNHQPHPVQPELNWLKVG